MHPRHIFGVPDFFFVAEQIAVFIDGCFWHRCPACKRTMPASNRRYWRQKLDLNVARARRINAQLRRRGIIVIRIWEHQLRNADSLAAIISRIQGACKERTSTV